ncbi:unnamed protein product [Linum trigynum]|uniref:Uncharacterized protein n=1 Tax=Linum trigynum TaxID=586398 RepID=A0AAV2DA20_9ROSI
MSLDHPFMQGLRLHPEYADQYRRVINGVFHRHHHLVWGVFQQLHYMEEIVAAISHPQWRMLLSIKDSTYTELVWEFYSTFQYRPKAARDSPTSVTFQLGGHIRELSIDGLAQALGIHYHPFSHHEKEVAHPKDWLQDVFYQSIARPDYQFDPFDAGQTYVSTLLLE